MLSILSSSARGRTHSRLAGAGQFIWSVRRREGHSAEPRIRHNDPWTKRPLHDHEKPWNHSNDMFLMEILEVLCQREAKARHVLGTTLASWHNWIRARRIRGTPRHHWSR